MDVDTSGPNGLSTQPQPPISIPPSEGIEDISPMQENPFQDIVFGQGYQKPDSDILVRNEAGEFQPLIRPMPSTSSGSFRPTRLIHFKVEYRDKNISLVVPDSESVGKYPILYVSDPELAETLSVHT